MTALPRRTETPAALIHDSAEEEDGAGVSIAEKEQEGMIDAGVTANPWARAYGGAGSEAHRRK